MKQPSTSIIISPPPGTLNLQLESSTLGSSIIAFDGSSSATLSLSVPATLSVTGDV